MAKPWYSFYPGDYARDTGHLSLTEHGAYRALMDLYYSQGAPLANDLQRLLHVCRARSTAERQAVRRVLGEFFVLADGRYSHGRIDAEIEKAAEISKKCSAAAATREAKRRALRDCATTDDASDGHPSQPQSQPQSQTKEENDFGFADFWKAYPRKEARGAARVAYLRVCGSVPPATLIAAAADYAKLREGQDRKYTRQAANWLAQECWLDDAPLPQVPVDAAAWGGAAARLAAEIGAENFQAYFSQVNFSPGPPVRLAMGKAHLRDLIARKFGSALRRVFGDFILEAMF